MRRCVNAKQVYCISVPLVPLLLRPHTQHISWLKVICVKIICIVLELKTSIHTSKSFNIRFFVQEQSVMVTEVAFFNIVMIKWFKQL